MWNHITVIRWVVQITPETFQEATSWMNEGLCLVQTLHLHMCISVAVQCVILIPYIVPWNVPMILIVFLQPLCWYPVESQRA